MVSRRRRGLSALAVLSIGVVPLAGATPSAAQTPGAVQPGAPVPDPIELSKLIWSTMAAIDQANRSGNYSVLRDLGAPGFQANNDAARLAQIFAGLRNANVDLSNTLLLAPTYRTAPAIVGPGMMRVTGGFGLRPVGIDFDLIFQYSANRWKLFGVGIQPSQLATVQPQPAAKPAPAKPTRRP